ncbi:MAG: DNA repair protein RecN [Bosea sp. (in: a-proteobacteria)]
MLARLSIRDIVLISQLDLEFSGGLSVLTGETGAGKSILLDAFALALGGRGDGDLVRHGQPQGQVTAVFDIRAGHPVLALLKEQSLESDGDLILRRIQHADGRTRAFVNDQPVSVQALKQIGASMVEIHGQHDDRALVDPAEHRTILDAYGSLQADAAELAEAHERLKTARAALVRQEARIAAARKEADYLNSAVTELSKLSPEAGEEEFLATRRQEMMQAEKVAKDIAEAFEAVGGTASPIPGLAGVVRRLERRGAQAPALVEPSVKAMDAAIVALEEARSQLEQAMRDVAFDPKALERSEERLFALRGASRKYNVPVEGLMALCAKHAAELAALDAGEKELKQLTQDVAAAEAAYLKLAKALSAARAKAAAALDKAVLVELPPLKLERARFITRIEVDADARAAEGFDHVEFWVETNPGTKPGPMLKVASGGELSRFMLALKVVLADKGSAPTLVFDEIDTGVGGAVADAIGERLARLAGKVQVMSVTHAPQVAAKAAHHFLIAKSQMADADRVMTQVSVLEDASRREEIARMLAGATITQEARAAAARLLAAG